MIDFDGKNKLSTKSKSDDNFIPLNPNKVCQFQVFISSLVIRLVRRRRTPPPPPGDFVTPNAAGTPPAYIGVRRVFCDFKINFLFTIISDDPSKNY